MSGPGASSGEMPEFPFPRRPGGELDESLLDALLNGQPLPPDAPEQVQVVAEMLASLAGPPTLGELAGAAAARSAFARSASRAGVSPVVRRSARRRPSWLPARVSAGLAAGLVAAAVGLGGAAAAYAGDLPGPIQDLAHHMLHTLPARPASRPKPQPGKQKPHATSRPAEPGKADSQGNATGPANRKGHANVKRHANAKANGNAKGHASAKVNGNAKGHASAKHIATRGGPAAQPGTGKPPPAQPGPRGKSAAELARGWIGMDCYYEGPTQTFATLFSPTLAAIHKFTHKPVLIAETGVGQVAGQAAKIPGPFAGIRARHLLGLVWFDKAQHYGINHQDWQLEGHKAAITAFRKEVRTYR